MAKRPNKTKTQPRNIKAAKRRREALELRERGWTYVQIAAEIGVTPSAAWKSVKVGMDILVKEPAERVRVLETQRLDIALKAIMKKVESGDLNAIDRMIALQGRRSKFLALDAPKAVHADLPEQAAPVDQFEDKSAADLDYYARHGYYPDEAPMRPRPVDKERVDHLKELH